MSIDLQPDEAITAAARWLASDPDPTGKALVPTLKVRFGLDTMSAIEAIRQATLLRRQGGANVSL
ncbi:hypothetical protein ACFX5Q_07390 [Mesorhizobium sp. IMUNJ 23033]|uniref:hypothetical protein n=1 Tax=Mesorhizobium sp. IMUNJ 23033 TaxID=3378039 RepID=UPI003850F869